MGKFLLPFKEGRASDSRFSPTSIFVSSIFMGILLSLQTELMILLGLIGLVLLFGTLARTRWRVVLSLAARFEVVILFWVLLLPFFYGSTVILSISVPWGQLIAYQEGLEFGILIGF
ncbi:MAG: hypothetical protein RTV31_05085, partial [Candidatus Thorarchaeota archaeon]